VGVPPISAAHACALAVLLALSGCASPPGDAARAVDQPLVEQCPTAEEEGIDIFDGQGRVDWRAVAASGVRFAIVKATQGTYDTQATFGANWAGARAAGIARGAYHFFDPTEDGTLQAAHFVAVVGPLEADDLGPVLDIECPDGDESCLYDGAAGDASAAEIHDRMWDFLREVARATGRVPVVYTFGSYFASNAVDVTGLAAYPLFLAYPTEASCLAVPPPWSQAAAWQYSWTGAVSGIAGAVDRDRWFGPLVASSSAISTASTAPAPLVSASASSTASGTASAEASSADAVLLGSSSTRVSSAPASTVSASCRLAPSGRASPSLFAWIVGCAALLRAKRRLPWRVGAC
jgi:GH25 family lysozyme M1 (1,4-beta-N-acetylmuramidase)